MESEKTNWKPVPLAMDEDLKREVEAVAKLLGQKQASVMRDAIRKGLPLLRAGSAGDSLTLDSELSRYVDEIGKAYNRTRHWVLLEAIRRGARSVNVHLMHASGGDVPPEVSRAMLQSDPDAEPHLKEVRKAKIERGALQIRLDDLLQHCPEARERAELMEKVQTLGCQKHGSYPSMWGRGISTAELRKHLAAIEAAQPTPLASRLPASPAAFTVRRIVKLPVTVQTSTAQPTPKPAAKPRQAKTK